MATIISLTGNIPTQTKIKINLKQFTWKAIEIAMCQVQSRSQRSIASQIEIQEHQGRWGTAHGPDLILASKEKQTFVKGCIVRSEGTMTSNWTPLPAFA